MAFVSTILCVDDDEDDLSFIRDMVRAQPHDFSFVEAKNGLEALQILELALANNSLPCLIIMDMNMPKMNGKETIEKIRQNEVLATIPVVVFTTSTSGLDRSYFEDKGIHFISKPFDYTGFNNRIKDLLAFCAELKN